MEVQARCSVIDRKSAYDVCDLDIDTLPTRVNGKSKLYIHILIHPCLLAGFTSHFPLVYKSVSVTVDSGILNWLRGSSCLSQVTSFLRQLMACFFLVILPLSPRAFPVDHLGDRSLVAFLVPNKRTSHARTHDSHVRLQTTKAPRT